MNIEELRDALTTMIDNGHEEAVVSSVNGTGKVSVITGWELVLAGGYEPQRGADQKPVKKALKFFTIARF